MILVDVNIPLYAEDAFSPHQAAAQKWWEEQLSGAETVALCWPVITAFIRIGTHLRAMRRPLTLKEATARVQEWMAQPCVRVIEPTEAHWTIFQKLLLENNAPANLVTDAHLAALAVEHNATLYSADADFSRFPGLKWKNPLTSNGDK